MPSTGFCVAARPRRIYDRSNDTLIYVAYSRQVKDASAKMSVTTVPLGLAQASWLGRKP